MARVLFLLAVLAACLPSTARAESYDIETIRSNVIWYPSLAIDGAGDAHLAYYWVASSDYGIAYSHRHLGTWTTETMAPSAVVNTVALALDPSGQPHVAYYTGPNPRPYFASRSGGQWSAEPVDAVGDYSGTLSLGFDAQGRPHLAYPWNGQLKHAWREGGTWTTEVVDPALGTDSYPGTSLRVDVLGRVGVSYHRGTTLAFARKTGDTWSLATIPAGPAYVATSLATDDAGKACFTYLDNAGLHLAQETANGWTTEWIDAGSGAGGSSSLALDGTSRPHVAYYDAPNGRIMYAHRTGTTWRLGVVDDRFRSGQETALALDGTGQPVFAYTFKGYTGGSLRYATASPPVTGVGDPAASAALTLAPPWPNPAPGRGPATFSFVLPRAASVSLSLLDVAGRRIASRAAAPFALGPNRVLWDPGPLAPGLYRVRVVASSGETAEQRWVVSR
jgi:hypothetical protein